MNHYKNIIFSLLMTLFLTPIFFYSYTPLKPTAIIFDLSGVLFKENTTVLRQKIGIFSLANYALTHWKNPATVCFDLLEIMSKQSKHRPPEQFKFKKRIMPRCIVEWQQGHKTCYQVQVEVNDFIEQMAQQNYFSSTQEKDLIKQIVEIVFDAQHFPSLTQPIPSMIDLAKKLKAAGYRLFFIANAPHELCDAIKTTYPDIVKLFDGKVISCETHILKPNKQVFSTLLDTYHLNPQECIFVDTDKEENIKIAQKFGICSTTYQKTSLLIKKLKELGIRVS